MRNNGAIAVVKGAGLNACEYMSNGLVVILGPTTHNLGAGMTGGKLFVFDNPGSAVNSDYIGEEKISGEEYQNLKKLPQDYHSETNSSKTVYILKDLENTQSKFRKFVPIALLEEEKRGLTLRPDEMQDEGRNQ